VAEVMDDAVMGGRFGMAATAFEEPGVQFLFDNFDLWRLEP
jgi:hypothetical protein